MIRFATAILDHQELDLAGTEPATLLELENDPMLTAGRDIRYQLHVRKVSGGALVTGMAGTVISGVCGRCLAPVEQEVATDELSLFYELEGVEELDITEDIRAELLLNMPVNLLCGPDCAGLCPVCGANRNLHPCHCRMPDDEPPPDAPPGDDSPWSALDRLKQ